MPSSAALPWPRQWVNICKGFSNRYPLGCNTGDCLETPGCLPAGGLKGWLEDLADVTTMSFLEHLEELRKRLIICIFAMVIGMGIAWPMVPWVQKIITRPLNEPSITEKWHYSIESYLIRKFPDAAKGFGLEKPEPPKVNPHKLNYMAPLEPFFVQMKISLITGLALAFPMILYQLWLFFAPALYPKERRLILFFIPLGTVAFILGDLFFLNLVWPLVISFSLRYESEVLFSMLNLTQFVNFCTRLLLLFGLIFELPLILLILARVGLVGVDALRRQRRLAILLSAVVAAFHADVLTMMAIAIPIYLMYELSILTVRLFGRAAADEEEEAEALPAETGLGPPPAS